MDRLEKEISKIVGKTINTPERISNGYIKSF